MRAARVEVSEAASATEIRIGGEACLLEPSGGLFILRTGTLVVADLHFEKGSAFARRGAMLPPYDTAATLACLGETIARLAPREVVALGDSFHDRRGPDRLGEADRTALAALVSARSWTWITGNHDPDLPPGIGGTVAAEARRGDLVLRHHPRTGEPRELAGHLHPVAKVVLYGRGVRARAFLTDGARCVLPAFGAYAGGLNACDPAFAPLFPGGFTAHVIGRTRMFAISRAALCGE